MRDFRRSVFRLLLITCILLFGAWVLAKVARYHGDLELILRDLQNNGVTRFVQDKVLPFFQEKVIPKAQELSGPVKDFFDTHIGG